MIEALKLPRRRGKRIALFFVAVSFALVGITHFTSPALFVRIMPEYLPAHLELVYLSGVCEIAGGVAVLVPRLRGLAGWALIALLVAVFPANIHMALHPERFPEVSVAVLYARLPLQPLIGWLSWWSTRPDPPS